MKSRLTDSIVVRYPDGNYFLWLLLFIDELACRDTATALQYIVIQDNDHIFSGVFDIFNQIDQAFTKAITFPPVVDANSLLVCLVEAVEAVVALASLEAALGKLQQMQRTRIKCGE